MEFVVPIVVALVAVLAAWKLFKGVLKTAALVGVLALAGIYTFGGGFA